MKQIFKRTFDVLAALVAIVLLSPVIAVVGLAMKPTNRGPAIFKQERAGKRAGRLFIISSEQVFRLYGSGKAGHHRH